MGKAGAFSVTILAALAASTSIVAWHEHRELDFEQEAIRRVSILASENDGLRTALADARRKAMDTQNAVRREQIEKDVAVIRALPFKKPVEFEALDHAGIRKVVAGKMSEQYTDQEIQDMADGYSALGLLPPHFPLKQTYVNLLGEQIAAFYDQHQHKLFMFEDADLENSQNRVILAHELTHALQDQNFGLLSMALEVKNDDDRAEAASALIEGDATLVMSEYMTRDLSAKTFLDTVTYSATQSMEEIRKAPRYLRELLVFPYLKGEKFCADVYAEGGYAALSDVYKRPPTSTAQILHPEKYFAHEEPVEIKFPDTLLEGKKPFADNTLGEIGCRILLSQYLDEVTAENVAAGWRGDRYLVYGNGTGDVSYLVWKTVWNSPKAATDASDAISKMFASKYALGWDEKSRTGAVLDAKTKGGEIEVVSDGHNGMTFLLYWGSGLGTKVSLRELAEPSANQR